MKNYLRLMLGKKSVRAEEGQTVKRSIIALEDHTRICRALVMVSDVSFYRYEVRFRLVPQT